uniref:Large ribosomal subunit protein uL24c n=1 Tax=Pleurostichidium falkenbergii TaxID=121064 RepID=A0A4D6UXJ5_9FLOR|nr:ribosomal protein L24 [Pleurostichidium falkenbergii]QCH39705.1 ribosomal protein L24 [Pleurostichidium falkenbergii]
MEKNIMKTQIKKGDNVSIISGKHKGKCGKVSHVLRNKNQIIIDNINIKVKHVKPKQTEDKGYIKKVEYPIHYSNVRLTKTSK